MRLVLPSSTVASNLECAGLTALSWPAALTQAPTADASKNSQQALQVHFEDKSLRNVRFKNAASFSVLVWGRCQASANESGVKPSHSKKPRPLVVAEKRPNSERSRSAPFRKQRRSFELPVGRVECALLRALERARERAFPKVWTF